MVLRITILLLLLSSFMPTKLSCQSDDNAVRHWSFGISAGDILHSIFNTENANRSYAAFVLEYSGNKYALQAGFRPGYNQSNTAHEGFSDSEVTDQLSMSGHLNLTRTVFSDMRWMLRAGLKYQGGWSREDITEESGFDRIITRRLEWNAGLGPVLDIRYFIHPRISVGTEASLLYTYDVSELQVHFTNFPDFDTTKDKVTGHKVDVLEPMTLYLRFHL